MPYALSFTKAISVDDPDIYFNEYCTGGDIISDQLPPMIRENYSDFHHNQEDWGWFVWFKGGRSKLAIDIFCAKPDRGEYRIYLTSQIRPSLICYRIVDSEELIVLKSRTRRILADWVDSEIVETLPDRNHDPVGAA